MLAEVERSPSLQNLVDLEHAVEEHQLVDAEPLALVQQDPGANISEGIPQFHPKEESSKPERT